MVPLLEKDVLSKLQQTKQKDKTDKFFEISARVANKRFITGIVKNPRIQY